MVPTYGLVFFGKAMKIILFLFAIASAILETQSIGGTSNDYNPIRIPKYIVPLILVLFTLLTTIFANSWLINKLRQLISAAKTKQKLLLLIDRTVQKRNSHLLERNIQQSIKKEPGKSVRDSQRGLNRANLADGIDRTLMSGLKDQLSQQLSSRNLPLTSNGIRSASSGIPYKQAARESPFSSPALSQPGTARNSFRSTDKTINVDLLENSSVKVNSLTSSASSVNSGKPILKKSKKRPLSQGKYKLDDIEMNLLPSRQMQDSDLDDEDVIYVCHI